MSDLFSMKSETNKRKNTKKTYTRRTRKKTQMQKLLESMKSVDITMNEQARKRKHSEFFKRIR